MRGNPGHDRIVFFREAPSRQRIVGVGFAIIGLFLLRKYFPKLPNTGARVEFRASFQ